jgi:hypothetical protein
MCYGNKKGVKSHIFFGFLVCIIINIGNIISGHCDQKKLEVKVDQINLISNPSMEEGADGQPHGWKTKKFKSGPEFVWNSRESHSGRYSLKVKGPGSGAWLTTVPITYGKKYRISLFIKSFSKKDYNPDANVYAYVTKDGKGGSRPVQWVNDFKMNTYKDWTKIIMGDYIARDGDKELTLELWLNGNRKEVSPVEDSSIWFDDACIEEINCPPIKEPCYLIHKDSNFALWSAHALSSVYKEEPVPEEAPKDFIIALRGARGEHTAFQLVVRPEKAWENVTWEWEDFAGPSAFPKKAMKYFRVEYINLSENSQEDKDYVRGGMTPDPIPAERPSTLLENQNNPFFFEIHIPNNVREGSYSSKLKLTENGKVVAIVPMEITIWRFAIPKKPAIEMVANLWTNILTHYEKGNELDMLERYLNNLIDHRAITPVGTFKSKIIGDKPTTRHISIDTTGFDDLIAFQKQCEWCDNLIVHWSNFKINSGFGVPIFIDATNEEFNPEFVRLFKELLRQLNDCIKEQGCYSSFKVQIGDEPQIRNQAIVSYYTNVAKLFKLVDPSIRTFSTGIFHLNFLPYYDRWYFSNLRIPFAQTEINLLEKNKKSVGIYFNNMTNPSVPPIKLRLLSWALWKEKYAGLYWWQINGWGRNVTQVDTLGRNLSYFQKNDPWKGQFKGVVFIYPPREGKNEVGPINSLRWEALRAGLEDVEYFNLLDRLIKQNKGKMSEEEVLKAQKALDRINEVVSHVPCAGIIDTDQFNTYDISLVEEVKNEIAVAIEGIMRNP